jgi:hypothetical protein
MAKTSASPRHAVRRCGARVSEAQARVIGQTEDFGMPEFLPCRIVVDMKGSGATSRGHRHCPPLSSPNRCFPVTIPRMSAAAPSLRLLGVEEHHDTSRRQTPC